MNNIIKQLSQIEDQSVRILDTGAARKKELTAEYEEKTRQFDESLDREIDHKIASLRKEMEDAADARLKGQKEEAKAAISCLEQHYEAGHEKYVAALFKKMTEV